MTSWNWYKYMYWGKKIIIITLNINNRYCSKIYMITYCTSASTVPIVYESNVLLILGYTFTSKFNTSRFSYSYLVRVLHTKAHITQGNKNMYQKKITCCSKQAEPKLRWHWVLHLASQSVFFSASDFSDFSGFSSSVSV